MSVMWLRPIKVDSFIRWLKPTVKQIQTTILDLLHHPYKKQH